MSDIDPLDRELTAWFLDGARPRTPDYAGDIIRRTAGARQRPRWTFLERWLPMSVTLGRVAVEPLPWRAIGLLVVLALLVAAVVGISVGSRRSLPAPFGTAGNGLVAYSWGGDIYTVDPRTGTRDLVVPGPTVDHDPRFSLDGTRLAFKRDTGLGDSLVISDADGSHQLVANLSPLVEIDIDGIAWSPDGRSIAVALNLDGRPAINIIDTSNGEATELAVDYQVMEAYWRPPDGRQLMFFGGPESDPGLFVVALEDGTVERLPTSGDGTNLRPLGWTPDGSHFVRGGDGLETLLTDAVTGVDTILPVGFGQLSQDGTRMAGLGGDGFGEWLCIASVGGGPCVRAGGGIPPPDGGYHEGLHWSPDDEWIVLRPSAQGDAIIVDPDGEDRRQPSWIADGAETWQRVAP
jgi:Tol biopolymer transport system component